MMKLPFLPKPFIILTFFSLFDPVLVILEVEEKLDKALREGDYDSIEEQVTPKTLTSCKTNALLKAFEVCYGPRKITFSTG